MNIFISLFGILLTLVLIIGIHECGHFFAARCLGVKVIRFSLGFGKPLWHRCDHRGTEYVIAAIPLGGYVKMVDETEDDVAATDLPYAFNRQPIWKKIIIIAAGPFANFLLAFVLYWLLFFVGFNSIAPIIGKVTPNSIASQAGLKPQQEIIRVNQELTPTWVNIVIQMLMRAGDRTTMIIDVKNPQQTALTSYHLNLQQWQLDQLKPDPLKSIGIEPFEINIPATIGTIEPTSPAKNNLKTGDKIITVNQKPIADWIELVQMIQNHPEAVLQITLQRQGKTLTTSVTTRYRRTLFFRKIGVLGIAPQFTWPKELLRKNKYGPIEALPHAWLEIKNFTYLNLLVIEKMLTGKLSLQSLGGPITIFESAGNALNSGMLTFLTFLAFFSLSIGVINVLPIPGLDGGHLLFQLIELVIRRPIPLRWQWLLFRLGMIVLVLIFVQAIINDVMRL